MVTMKTKQKATAKLSDLEQRVLNAVRHLETPKRREVAKSLRIHPHKARAALLKLKKMGLLKLHGVKGGAYWTVKATK